MRKRIHFERSRRLGIATVILLAATCAGCGSKTSPVAAVRGNVTLNDKPLANGVITTIPTGGRGAKGVIRDGEFELGTFSTSDGALIGTHKVSISANEPSQSADPEAPVGKSLVPDRYTNHETSRLTIEVKAGETNTPTLKLTSP